MSVSIKYDAETRRLRLVVGGVAVDRPEQIVFSPDGKGGHTLTFATLGHQDGLGQAAKAMRITHVVVGTPEDKARKYIEDYFG